MSGRIADSCGRIEALLEGKYFVVRWVRSGWNYFCEAGLRRASIQKGEHQSTIDPGLRVRAHHQLSPTTLEPRRLQAAQRCIVPAKQRRFPRWESRVLG